MSINVISDPGPPLKVGVHLDCRPDPGAGLDVLEAEGGLKETFFTAMGTSLDWRPSQQRWFFAWTDVNSERFRTWLLLWKSRGLNGVMVADTLNALSSLPVAQTLPIATRARVSIESYPPDQFLCLQPLDYCDPEVFNALAKIPGVFTLKKSGRPVPLTDPWVEEWKRVRGVYPSVAFAPKVHVSMLAKVLPSVARQEQELRKEAGLDHPVYPPEAFVVPGINPSNGKPIRIRPYQAEGISRFLAQRRLVFGWFVGGGKTVGALAPSEVLLGQNIVDVAVVTCNTSLQQQWARFVAAYYGRPSVVIDGEPEQRMRQYAYAATHHVPYVINRYDQWSCREAPTHLGGLLGPRTVAIYDEAQIIKNPRTQRYSSYTMLLDGYRPDASGSLVPHPELFVPWRLGLTGSLAGDKEPDVYGIVSALGYRLWNDKAEFDRTYFRISHRATGRKDRYGRDILREKVEGLKDDALSLLQEVLREVCFVRTREQVGLQLPPLMQHLVPLEPSKLEQAAYLVLRGQRQELQSALEAVQGKGDPRARELAEDLWGTYMLERSFCTDPALLLYSESPMAAMLRDRIGVDALMKMTPGTKTQWILDWLTNFLESDPGKVVVFCSALKWLEHLFNLAQNPPPTMPKTDQARLRAIVPQMVMYHGGLSSTQRDQAVQYFVHDPRYRVFVATSAGGPGLDSLQNVASVAIHVDLPPSLLDLEQRTGRVYRPGQERPTTIYHLELAPESTALEELEGVRFVDPRLRELIASKTARKEALMAGL